MAGFLFIPGIAIYYLIKGGTMGSPDYTFALMLQTIAMFLVPGMMLLGYFFLKQGLKSIDTTLSLDQKLQRYLSLFLIRCALFEVPFLFCAAAALITKETLFIWSMPAILLIFMLLRPSADSVAEDLQLTPSEKKQLTYL
jgi:hypothetical protein